MTTVLDAAALPVVWMIVKVSLLLAGAGLAQAPRDPPYARVEPVQRARNRREQLRQAVVTGDMRQFVQQHCPSSLLGPRIGDCRDEDRGAPDAERHGHVVLATAQEANRTSDIHALRALDLEPRPVRIAHVSRPPGQLLHRPSFRGESNRQEQDADRIHGEQYGR